MGPALELRVRKQKKEFVLQKWSINSEPESRLWTLVFVGAMKCIFKKKKTLICFKFIRNIYCHNDDIIFFLI